MQRALTDINLEGITRCTSGKSTISGTGLSINLDSVPIPLFGWRATSSRLLKRELSVRPRIAICHFGAASPRGVFQSLTGVSLYYSRYVALKFAVAELTGKNNEIKIYRHLASQTGTHPGSERVLALLDDFRVQGVNGEHNVLVLQVVGPRLGAMFNEEPTVIQQSIKSLVHQVALGTSFLHHYGIVHAG